MKLVTGATGLVGSHLILELLTRGDDKIIATKRKTSKVESLKKVFSYYVPEDEVEKLYSRIEWREADLLNAYEIYEAMEGVDEVYHCAGMVSYLPRDKQRVFEINIHGTANTVNAALERKVEKFVYVSSVAALGSTLSGKITEETYAVPEEKFSIYSKSKYYAELEVWRGQEEGLNIVIVNPSVILGPPADWKEKMIGRLFLQVWKGLPVYIDGVVGFVDVRDVARAMVMLAERQIFGQRFIVSAENLSYYQVLSMVAEALGKPKPKYKLSTGVLKVAYGFDKIRSTLTHLDPIITREIINYVGDVQYYSNEKLLSYLPDFKFIPIRETIEFMAKIFKQQLSEQNLDKERFWFKIL